MASSLCQEKSVNLGSTINPFHILIVDDSADDSELLARALQRGGFVVHSRRVWTEPQLRQALADKTWDCIFVDWILPEFSGPAALRILAEQSTSTPCIVVSGAAGEDIAVLAIKLGAVDFVLKDRIEMLPSILQRELHFAGLDG